MVKAHGASKQQHPGENEHQGMLASGSDSRLAMRKYLVLLVGILSQAAR